MNNLVYFPGSFLPKNLFFDYMKCRTSSYAEDSKSLTEIIKEFYDIPDLNLPDPEPGDLIFDSQF